MTAAIALAVRQLMIRHEREDSTADLAAFIALALGEVHKSVEGTVTAWENKGYWIKADRYRLEWEWTETYGKRMREAIQDEDWETINLITVRIAEKLSNIKIPIKHRMGEPWKGALQRLKQLGPPG